MDNDNKKSSGDSVQKPPTNPIFLTTAEVATRLGVTKQAVEKWRKQGRFTENHIDIHGVYWYTAERVEQLKAVYHPNWTRGGYQSALDGEKKSVPELFAEVEKRKTDWKSRAEPPKSFEMADYFAHQLKADIDALKNYAQRTTGFNNIDEQQFFSPGLYVIGATPAAGKTTFCWQLLEQLTEKGESVFTARMK